MLFKAITNQIEALDTDAISMLRKDALQSLINYIKHKADHDKPTIGKINHSPTTNKVENQATRRINLSRKILALRKGNSIGEISRTRVLSKITQLLRNA